MPSAATRVACASAALIMVACSGSKPRPVSGRGEPVVDTCRVELGPRADKATSTEAPFPVPPAKASRTILHAALKTAGLKKELEAKVPARVADARGQSIGVGGYVDVTVDRGPFSVVVEGESLVVRTSVRAHAQACISANRCYASCDPEGVATATVPLRLTPEYRFAPSRVSVAFIRGCQVRALGGLVRIDVTPIVERQMQPQLREVERAIDQRLPQIRPQAERLWAELSKPRPLPIGDGCAVVQPGGITQGPVRGTPDLLVVRFAFHARPELRTRCGDPPKTGALPPLAYDPALPAEDEQEVAIVSPLASIARAAEVMDPVDLGRARARAGRAEASPSGGGVRLALSLRGDTCGDVAVRSPLAWTTDGQAIHLEHAAIEEPERLAGFSLDPGALGRDLEGKLKVTPTIGPDALKEMLPALASALADPTMDVNATVSSAKPSRAFARGDDMVATIRLRGSVELRQR